MDWKPALLQLADTWLARCWIDAVLRRRAHGRLVSLDHEDVEAAQARILRGLVHRARNTPFGRDHELARVRTPADFRRLVPLRTAARLWREYGPAGSGGQFSEALPFLALTDELLQTHRKAALTALALVLQARPHARLCSGQLLLVGGNGLSDVPDDRAQAVRLEAFAREKLPALLTPYLAWTAVPDDGPSSTEDRFHVSVEESTRLPVTCLVGPTGRLVRLLEIVQRLTGREHVTDVWPRLAAVLHLSDTAGPGHSRLTRLAGAAAVPCLEVWSRPEGVLAVEDPRHGLLRLLVDHGIYYEFVPVESLHDPEPERLGAGEVEPGLPYAVAVTSPVGLWACLTGQVVRFEDRRPPLLRLMEAAPAERPAPASTRARTDGAAPTIIPQPPHPRSAGIPAVLPGTPFHSPWSTPGGRG